LSRRPIVASERETEKKDILSSIQEGNVVEGVIKNITDYGIFIDLGGIDGLLHVTDISWGRIAKPAESFHKGEKITVRVLSFDREKERVSLGLKQLTDNPWEQIIEKYPVSSIVEGKVVNLTDYGVFCGIGTGRRGISPYIRNVLDQRNKTSFKSIEYRRNNKSCGFRSKSGIQENFFKFEANGTQSLGKTKEKYPVGTTVKGVVRNITNFGVFVGIEEGIDGLVHVSDISWKHRVTHPSEYFKKGQEVEAVVLNVDVDNEKFSLGIKQIEKNPWDELSKSILPVAL